MLGLFIILRTTWRTVRSIMDSPESRGLGILVLALILGGSVFYHWHEQFTWIDSFYLTIMTLTTVGYGDVHPVSNIGKIFTMLYVLIGVGIMVAFVSTTAAHAVKVANEARSARDAR